MNDNRLFAKLIEEQVDINQELVFLENDRLRQSICENPIPVLSDPQQIRAAALAFCATQIDRYLETLKGGQGIAVALRVEVINSDGTLSAETAARNAPETRWWKKAVWKKCHGKCVECGSRKDINAHHIKPWADHPELRYEVGNGILLCADCHAKKHPNLANLILRSRDYRQRCREMISSRNARKKKHKSRA